MPKPKETVINERVTVVSWPKVKKFPLGSICISPLAQEMLKQTHTSPLELLDNHTERDWRDVSDIVVQENERALKAFHKKSASNTKSIVISCYQVGFNESSRVVIVTDFYKKTTVLVLKDDCIDGLTEKAKAELT